MWLFYLSYQPWQVAPYFSFSFWWLWNWGWALFFPAWFTRKANEFAYIFILCLIRGIEFLMIFMTVWLSTAFLFSRIIASNSLHASSTLWLKLCLPLWWKFAKGYHPKCLSSRQEGLEKVMRLAALTYYLFPGSVRVFWRHPCDYRDDYLSWETKYRMPWGSECWERY